jgi:hypothetical protein
VGKKRLRVEALLGAAAAPLPPPAADLVPDPTLADELFPEDLPRLLGLLARADLYLHGEVEVALHPTLTRVWSRSGRAGRRRVQAPGNNAKQYGFGLRRRCCRRSAARSHPTSSRLREELNHAA